MSTLEQILFKVYTDANYRRNIREGVEQLLELSQEERDAVRTLSFQQVHDGPIDEDKRCDRR